MARDDGVLLSCRQQMYSAVGLHNAVKRKPELLQEIAAVDASQKFDADAKREMPDARGIGATGTTLFGVPYAILPDLSHSLAVVWIRMRRKEKGRRGGRR